MNKYYKFLVDNAVEKRIGMRECLFSYSKDYGIDRLEELAEKSDHITPHAIKKGETSVFLLDEGVVVKKDCRHFTRRFRRPKIITDRVVAARGLLMEAVCTLVANKSDYPSHTLLGVIYSPLRRRTIIAFERIPGDTFFKCMLEKESEEKCISEMLMIMHQCLLRGIFHGDANANNILFDTRDHVWKLIDFHQSAKLNTDVGMGLALQMGGLISLSLNAKVLRITYTKMVLEYLRTNFGNQPQHSSTFLHFMDIRLNNAWRLGRLNRRIMYNMATLGKPDILGILPLAPSDSYS